MKNIKYILLALMGLVIFNSCEDDIENTVPEDAVRPNITSSNGGTFLLQKINEEDEFQTFEWSEANFKMQVSPQYTLEVDNKDGQFIGQKIIASGISSPFTIKVGDFNKALLAAGFTDGETHEIILRVKAGNYLASDPVAMTVTTYFDAEPWSIVGSAVGGWGTDNDQYMAYDKNSETYSLNLDMSPGEFKFRAPKKDSDPWKYNLGLDAESPVLHDDGDDIALKDGGANIKVSGGNYTVTVNVTAKTFSITQNSASAFTDWSAAKLDAVGDGVSADNTNATADGSSWGWGNVLIADNEGLPTKDLATYTWTWKGIILEADAGFKIRTLNGENASNGISFDSGFETVDANASSDKVADAGGNISVTEKGEYDITITIDASNGDAKSIVIKEAAGEGVSQLYMVGGYDVIGNWAPENSALMTAVDSDDDGTIDFHEACLYLESDKGFKFIGQQNWDNGNYGLDNSNDNGTLIDDGGSSDIKVPENGFYYVWVDIANMSYKYVKMEWGVIGDLNDWASQTDLPYDAVNNKFTASITIPEGKTGFKLRSQNTSNAIYGDGEDWKYNVGPDAVTQGQIRDISGSGNFTKDPGTYTVSLSINFNGAPTVTFE